MSVAEKLKKLDTVSAAKFLLGQNLVREINGQKLVGRIVETEAYLGSNDVASHAYRGQTPRNSVMFGPPGHAYVYFTYGMHYCMNVVTSPKGIGEAVLIRALEPLQGLEIMKEQRSVIDTVNYCNGPAKLCQALSVNKALNGHDLSRPPLFLEIARKIAPKDIVTTTRIGIREEKPLPLRFYIEDNQYISKR